MPRQGCQDRVASTGLQGQDNKGRTERRRQSKKERHVRQLEQDSQNGAARTEQPERGSQNGTGRTRLQGQNRTGLPAQGCKKTTARTRQKGEESRKDSQNRTAR